MVTFIWQLSNLIQCYKNRVLKGKIMIVVEGKIINNLHEAYLWLRKAWMDEPYNMWYEEFGEKDSEYYRECIYINPVRGYDDYNDYIICNLEEFEEFMATN